MRLCQLWATVGHHHAIGVSPFRGRAPDASNCKQRRVRQRIPGPGLVALDALSLSPSIEGNEAAALGEAVSPEWRLELIRTRIVDGFGLELLPLLAGENERE